MTFIDFFAGIGGISLGLERAGHKCVGQVEIDPFCCRVLEKHWPGLWRHDDIGTLKAADIPDADLWTGGFPCQDISNAGKRAGIRGERSGLFFDFMRLAAEIRPRVLLLENVAALINRGLSIVLGTLAESGYDAEWDCIPAAAVGAPHIRNRVFLLAYTKQPRLQGHAGHGPTRNEPERNPPEQNGSTGETGALGGFPDAPIFGGNDGGRLERARRQQGAGSSGQWGVEPDVGRVADGVPARVDRLRSLGNAVVPQIAEYIGRLMT